MGASFSGGTHLCYSPLVATPYGFLQPTGGDIMQEQMLIYRLQADHDLIDRYYREISLAPGADLFRAGGKLKSPGYAPEYLTPRHMLSCSRVRSRRQCKRCRACSYM